MGTGASSPVIHPTAVVDPTATLGAGTVVWSHACILAGARIGEGCRIGHGAFVDRDVAIGSRVVIHNHACIYRPVTIGDDVFIGPHVVFANDPDPRASATRELAGVTWKVGAGATIGAHATVLSDLELAPHCLIGAGAVVARPTVAFGIYVGVPARLVGYRCSCGERYRHPLPEECVRCKTRF
jgi:UDP-2-acetamido-3-amino-2,3-dideoxy-glucuronate N-acetyltransferase